MLVASSLMVQARWPQARKSTVCVCWLVETISTLPNIVRVYVCVCAACMCVWCECFFFQPNYCSRLVDYACSVLSGGRGSVVLDPQRLVTLHHIATLLETFVQNSPTLVQLMRSNFMEEFRCVAINCTTKSDDTSVKTWALGDLHYTNACSCLKHFIDLIHAIILWLCHSLLDGKSARIPVSCCV